MFTEKNKFKLLLVILLVAFAVRVSVFPVVFSNGGIIFLGADPYYHARRILFTVLHFPATLVFDSYINYPIGSAIGWPPLYDEFTALVALIVGLGKPSLFTIEATTAVVPLIIGVFTVFLVFLIAEKIFDWRAGLLSAGIFAITPAHVYVSFLGMADHHVAETLLSTAAYLMFIIALKRMQTDNISFNDFKKNILKNSSYTIFIGILLALALFTWNGAPIFVGLIGIFIVVQFVIDRFLGRKSDYLILTGFTAFLVTLLIITPVAIGRGFDIYSYLPSMFHAGFLAAFILIFMLLGLMLKMNFKKWWYYPLLLVSISSVAFYSFAFFLPQFYGSLMEGVGYLFGGGVLGTIQEAMPLFYMGSDFTLNNVWGKYTLSFFVAIPAFILFIRKTVKEQYPPEEVFLIVWTLIVFTLTILQSRFAYLLSVNVAIFAAYFIISATKLSAPQKEISAKKRQKGMRKQDSASSAGILIGLFIMVILVLPNITVIKNIDTASILAPDLDFRESFLWLKDNSPETSYYGDPNRAAEYGVMSWWDYGNWIVYISQRPVVANNFQTGIDDAARFFMESDENKASRILDKRKARFVITDAQMVKLKFRSIAMLAGKNPDDYYETKGSSDAPIRSVNRENNDFFATMLSKLHVFDGNGLSQYRLVYESNTTAIRDPDIRYVKIFEYVPGATIAGNASDNGDINVTLNITTNQGRKFTYTRKISPEKGRYEIKVPYQTQGSKYGTKSNENYIIQNVNVTRMVSVSEQDVQEGRKLRVDLI